jgi:hypothetical protein
MFKRAAIVYFAFASALHAQTIVVNDNITAVPRPEGIFFRISKGLNDALGIDCGPAGCFTSIVLQYDAGTLRSGVITLDEQSDWFHVRPGDVFSAATITAGQFPTILNRDPLQNGEVEVGPGEFYLGVRTGLGYSYFDNGNYGPPNRNAYGWVRLRPDNGVLTMVENVMSYNSRGIVVGTTTVVPEPASLATMGVGLLLAIWRLRLPRPADN